MAGLRKTQAVRHSISSHFRSYTLPSLGPRQASGRLGGLSEADELHTKPKAGSVQKGTQLDAGPDKSKGKEAGRSTVVGTWAGPAGG